MAMAKWMCCIHLSPLTAWHILHISDSKWKIEIEIQCEMCISYSKLVSLTTLNHFLPIFNIRKLRVVDIDFDIEHNIAFFNGLLIQKEFTCWFHTISSSVVTLGMSMCVCVCTKYDWMYAACLNIVQCRQTFQSIDKCGNGL